MAQHVGPKSCIKRNIYSICICIIYNIPYLDIKVTISLSTRDISSSNGRNVRGSTIEGGGGSSDRPEKSILSKRAYEWK